MKSITKKIVALTLIMMSFSIVAFADQDEDSTLNYTKEIARQERVTVVIVAAVDRKLASVNPTDEGNPVKVTLIKRAHKARGHK